MKKILLILILLLTGCGNKYVVNDTSFFVMDTYVNVKIYSDHKDDDVFEAIENLFKNYDCLFNRFKPCDDINNVYQINHMNSDFLEIEPDLSDIINYGLTFNEYLDIGMGNLIDVWKDVILSKDGVPNYDDLLLIEKNAIELIDDKIYKDVNIDLGAIAKGFVVKKAGKLLEDYGYDKYIINAGGQVLVGRKYRNDVYNIGIKHPTQNGNLTIVKGENISVSTSGGYERFVEIEGVKYNHIINPKTLFPGDECISVSVVTKDPLLADALTTVLFLMPLEEGLAFLKEYNAEAIWLLNDGTIVRSEGFNNYE